MTTHSQSSAYVLPLADERATLATVGGKGASLARLVVAGLPVPDGFHVTTAAYRRFVDENDLQPGIVAALDLVDANQPSTLEAASHAIRELFAAAQTPSDVAGAIALAYAGLAGRDPLVAVRPQDGDASRVQQPRTPPARGESPGPAAEPMAVRSSATAEDLPEASFAGQQDTFLNVDGYGEVLAAVKRCWASLWTARAIGYRARQGIGIEGLSLAVVVQLLVPAEAAGILFTANPVTGRRDQAMISAAWGLGEAVVGGLVTPDSILVDRAGGKVLEHHIADKQVMTVRANGGTEEQAVPVELRRAPVLDDETAVELVRLGVQIEDLYGMPMDIEWALADGNLSIVQARPITALPGEAPVPDEPVEPPAEWPLPDPKGPYMRGSITDFMPDPLTPLFSTLAAPAINRGMQRTMAETIGGGSAVLENYLTTINDYAYLYVSLGCRDWLWILFRMGPAIPRLMRNAERHWREVARPRYQEAVARWRDLAPAALAASELLDGTIELTAAMADYLTALQVDALGAAAGTEGLFTAVYDRLVKKEGDPPAATLLLGADSKPIRAEKSLYDLAQWCRERPDLAAYLLDAPSDQIAARLAADASLPDEERPTGVGHDDLREWRLRFRDHLAEYGHSIYDLDFAKPLPVDQPQPLLEALKLYIRGGGTDPHQRQQRLLQARQQAVETALDRLGGLRLRLFRWTLRWAQSFALVREDSIFDIGLGYPALRGFLGELGRRFAAAGAIGHAGDIYWLELAEVERGAAALDAGQALPDLSSRVPERHAVWRAEKQLTPPQQLPAKGRVMGIKTDAFLPVDAEEQTSEFLKGVAASPGRVTGQARVLRGPEDFGQMQPGDVLVAEMTTPAWTPLFAMAAAIVTDVGGPLSHGSIVAREYGIPAVLGTGVATQRIQNGQTVTVDGAAGLVTLT